MPEMTHHPSTSVSLLTTPTTCTGHKKPGISTPFLSLTQGAARVEVQTPFTCWLPSSTLAPPWITLAAEDDPAILVGSGESCKEAFYAHQWRSRPRRSGFPLFHGSCGSCRAYEGLGLQAG